MKTTTMRGRPVDFNRLIAQNATMPALGNARMNARGDIIKTNGEIIKKREDTAKEYHRATSKSVKRVALKDVAGEILSPAAAMEAMKARQAAEAVLTTHANAARTAQSSPKRKLTEDE